jgi:hypothetical protein
VSREATEAKLAGIRGELRMPLSARADAVAAAQAEGGTNNNVTVTVETITEADIRRSSEEFGTDAAGVDRAGARTQEADSQTDLDSILFLGLGAAAVGTVLENGQEVVTNTGDRLVTLLDSGEYEVYRDDDVILREAGATIQTETFADGSIRTLLTREDATQVVTIRDAASRVLRRARILADGTEVELFDDLEETTRWMSSPYWSRRRCRSSRPCRTSTRRSCAPSSGRSRSTTQAEISRSARSGDLGGEEPRAFARYQRELRDRLRGGPQKASCPISSRWES